MSSASYKELPNSKESEMMVLGCMMSSRDNLNIAADLLDEGDFYFTEHKIIFSVLKTAFRGGKPADVHLVAEELKDQDKLKIVGGIAYLTTLVQFVGMSAYIDEYAQVVKEKAILRQLLNTARDIEKGSLKEPEDLQFFIEEIQRKFDSIKFYGGKNLPIIAPEDRFKEFDSATEKYRAQKYIGLTVKSINEFNEKILGLRDLILLGGPPNTGKTALAFQQGIEVLQQHSEACLVFVSLEMSASQMFTRAMLYLTEMPFRSLMFGTLNQGRLDDSSAAFFTEEEYLKIEKSKKILKDFGCRFQIIDQTICPVIDARTLIKYIEDLKIKTNCTRSLVIIDYLQVWPVPQNMRFPSDNEMDKWRIGEVKKIRDALKGDPIIVLSELRKPGDDNGWGAEIYEIIGSVRNIYTSDGVLLLTQMSPTNLQAGWLESSIVYDLTNFEKKYATNDPKKQKLVTGLAIRDLLSQLGISILNLKFDKGRDGMEKFNISLIFHYRQNKFIRLDWAYIKEIVNGPSKTKKFSISCPISSQNAPGAYVVA